MLHTGGVQKTVSPETIVQIRTYAYDPRENSEQCCIDIEEARAGVILPLSDLGPVSASDLGCAPGSLYTVEAAIPDGHGGEIVLESVMIEAR